MALLRVLLVEDHPVMQQAICGVLSQNCTVVGVLDRAEGISNAVRTLCPDILVLDVSLPGRSELQVLPELRREFPQLRIVIATNHVQPVYKEESYRRGADGFVPKNQLITELWPVVQNAYSARSLLPLRSNPLQEGLVTPNLSADV